MKQIYFVFGIFVIFFVSCTEGEEYPKMVESMMIRNQTVDTILVEIPAVNLYENPEFIRVLPNGDYYWQIEKERYELWMTENELENYFSKLSMWFVNHNDFSVIDKNRYSRMSDWIHYLHSDNWFGTVTHYNSHTLIINK